MHEFGPKVSIQFLKKWYAEWPPLPLVSGRCGNVCNSLLHKCLGKLCLKPGIQHMVHFWRFLNYASLTLMDTELLNLHIKSSDNYSSLFSPKLIFTFFLYIVIMPGICPFTDLFREINAVFTGSLYQILAVGPPTFISALHSFFLSFYFLYISSATKQTKVSIHIEHLNNEVNKLDLIHSDTE